MKKSILNKFARSLRHEQTDTEKKLWWYLRSRQFRGLKFRRQQALGPYIVDFCSFEGKLVIELDGGQHAQNLEKDVRRTKAIEASGFQVVRVWDNEILHDVEAVLGHILEMLIVSPSPQPSPLADAHREIPLCTHRLPFRGSRP